MQNKQGEEAWKVDTPKLVYAAWLVLVKKSDRNSIFSTKTTTYADVFNRITDSTG